MRKSIYVLFGMLLFISITAQASAASLTNTQTASILGLLRSFGADQSVIDSVAIALGGSSTPSANCVTISRVLTLGSSGQDVTNLQRYLVSEGYLTASPTGYYGFYTAQAVGKLQTTLGIVSSLSDSAYGFVGPKTRSAIACSSAVSDQGRTDATSDVSTQNGQTSTGDSSTKYALIDQGSLQQTKGDGFYVSGTANTPSVGLVISRGDKLYGSGMYPVAQGRWSIQVTGNQATNAPFTDGTYKVEIYDGNSNLLTSGALVIKLGNATESSVSPVQSYWAVIDSTSLSQTVGSGFSISGTTNAPSVGLSIGNGDKIYGSANYPVVQGRWSIPILEPIANGTYTVSIYSNNVLLTSGSLKIQSTATQVPVGDARSPWGQKLAVATSDIPIGQFRAYYFKQDATGNPGQQTQQSVVLNEPYWNYLNSNGGYGQSVDKQVGAYFVGKFIYTTTSAPIVFDLSNPQWDIARLYIDGALVNTYGANAGSPTYTHIFAAGTHIVSVEYESHWHAGTFAMRMGRIVTPSNTYTAATDIPNVLTALGQKIGTYTVAAASIYESADNVNGDVHLDLSNLTGPTVLVLSSYDPVRWKWNPAVNSSKVKAIVVYSFAGAAIPDLTTVPVYMVREVFNGDGNGSMTAAQVSAKIGRKVDSFVTAYSPSNMVFPAISATATAL